MSFTQDMTLRDAQAELRTLVDDGAACPCCSQFAKVYRRRIHATMARELIRLYRAAPTGEWFHLPTLLGHNGGDVTKCRYWGLLEEDERQRDDGGRAGYWRLTVRGGLWVQARISVPKYARVYDGRLLSLIGDNVTVVDALGKKFDYGELMAG